MKSHHLKTFPGYFQQVLDGRKKFEVRRDDRGFEEGDELHLHEWDPNSGDYTGRAIIVYAGYILREFALGLTPGWVVISLNTFMQHHTAKEGAAS